MKSRTFLSVFSLFIVMIPSSFLACSKNDNPISPVNPPDNKPDSPPTEETKNTVYEFMNIDSSDYHYFVGSESGGLDKSKDITPSSLWHTPLGNSSINAIEESKDDSLNLSDSSMMSFLNGNLHKTAYYKIINDTVYLNYDTNNYDAAWNKAGLFNSKDSIISLNIAAASFYNATTTKLASNSLSPGNFGFIDKSDIFGLNSGTGFLSAENMKNSDDLVQWINLKLNYKIEKR